MSRRPATISAFLASRRFALAGPALLSAVLGFALALAPSHLMAGTEDAQIYLTWNAPWGYPRATDTLVAPCDTTGGDTLWVSCDSGKQSPTFLAFSATLLFRPAPGDSLSMWWYDDGKKQRAMHLDVAMDPHPGLGYPQPYNFNGGGGAFWAREKNDARLRLGYATPSSEAIGIQRKVYALARIIVHHPPRGSDACGQPVCIELTDGQLNYYFGTDHADFGHGAHRFVSLNSPDGAISLPYRKADKRGWKPKTP